jgi:hypothetical protein
MSVRIPAGKLGTLRVDRTVDIYPTTFNSESHLSTMVLQRQCTAIPRTFIIDDTEHERSYIPIIKTFNHDDEDDDEQISDIAVIYSVVRRASTRRTSSPRITVLPLSPNLVHSSPCIPKSYTLELPLTPVVTHTSKQAQIKTLTSTRTTRSSVSTPSSISSQCTHLTPPVRIQTSSSFTSHDRPSVPLIAVKPRPYSFRSPRRSVIERQISNITERVSQLHDSFFSRLSNTPNRQRNRSLSTVQSTISNTNINDVNTSNIHLIRPRPKSETYDDHHRVNAGKDFVSSSMVVGDHRGIYN